MTRDEVYAALMRRWPRYRLCDIPDMTPEQILWHFENQPDTVAFDTTEEYERWRAARTR